MKMFLLPLVALLAFLIPACPVHATLCAQCEGKVFIQDIGTCKLCKGDTSSGAFKMCRKCSEKLAQCEACGDALKAKTDAPAVGAPPAAPPAAGNQGAKPKAYPKHWGEPPRIQTKDLRPLPGGYGMGSGTLARWIQKNLDQDAKAPKVGADTAKAKEIQELEKKIADMEEFATRARFTPEGGRKHQEEIAALKEKLKVLKGESKPD